jgi:hypothetical protein
MKIQIVAWQVGKLRSRDHLRGEGLPRTLCGETVIGTVGAKRGPLLLAGNLGNFTGPVPFPPPAPPTSFMENICPACKQALARGQY